MPFFLLFFSFLRANSAWRRIKRIWPFASSPGLSHRASPSGQPGHFWASVNPSEMSDYITCPECLRDFKQRQIIYTGVCVCVYAHVCSVTHLSLCDPIDCSPPGSSVHGILQARILEGVAISSSRGSSWPRDQNCISCVSCIGRQTLYHWATWEAHIQSWPWNKSGMKESTQMQSRICQFIRHVKSFIYTKHRVFERSSGHWKKGHSCNLFHTEFCLNVF